MVENEIQNNSSPTSTNKITLVVLMVGIALIILVTGVIFFGKYLGIPQENSVQTGTNPEQTSQPLAKFGVTSFIPSIKLTPTPRPNTNSRITILVTKDRFNPDSVTVLPGTEVIWVNMSEEQIEIASNDHPTHEVYPPLNLGILQDGESVSLIFAAPGIYQYHNHIKPSQVGVVSVR